MSDRLNFYFKQLVGETDLDTAFTQLENADRNFATDHGLVGVTFGLDVAEQSVPNLTVRVSGPGAAYDQLGQRCAIPSTQTVNVAQDSNAVSTTVSTPGNSRVVSVFIKFKRLQSDLRTDGNGDPLYYSQSESFDLIVAAGAEAVSPTPPALRSDAILLADITRVYGGTTVVNGDISNARREWAFRTTGGFTIGAGRLSQALQAFVNAVAAPTGAAGVGYDDGGNIAADNVQDAITELDTEKAGLSLANLFSNALNTFQKAILIGSTLMSSDVDMGTARIKMQAPNATLKRVLVFGADAFGLGNNGAVRIYLSYFNGMPSLEFTFNAKWNTSYTPGDGNATDNWWQSDITGKRAWKMSMGYGEITGGVGFEMATIDPAVSGTTWEDTSWDASTTVAFGSTGGAILRTKTALEIEGNVGTDADLHGNLANTVSPNTNALYAKNVPKAWAYIVTDGAGNVAVNDGFNVTASITGGEIRVTFPHAFANDDYSVVVTSDSGYLHFATKDRTTSTVDILPTSISTDTAVNPAIAIMRLSVQVFGRVTF